jgi:predicted TIM-barrel fold metal-dependent hydrolase
VYTETHRIWHRDGKAFLKEPLAIEGRADGTPITDDLELRMKELAEDGTWGEAEYAMACARVFNDYLADAYGPYGDRELPVAMVVTMVASGVLERHPELQVLVVEAGAGWLAPLMEAMDFAWTPKTGHDRESELPVGIDEAGNEVARGFNFKQGGWKYSMQPSDYARRQVKVTFMDEPAPLRFLEVTGTEPLLWGSDFPHPEGTWPRSREVTDRLFAGVDQADKDAIVGGNLAGIFDLELPAV